jgi:peptide-methionine (R)-S-oxide reductase
MGDVGIMTPAVDRRTLLLAGSGVAVVGMGMGAGRALHRTMLGGVVIVTPVDHVRTRVLSRPPKPLRLTDAEWRGRLTPGAYDVLRGGREEYPFSSPLNVEMRPGIYGCAGCHLSLFVSDTKFDSGVGLASFFDHLPFAIEIKDDRREGFLQKAIFCARCDGFFGHVFHDGPAPTEMRYSPSGAAMEFSPA